MFRKPLSRRPLPLLLVAALATAAAAVAPPADATTYVMVDDGALADQAALVVQARVVGVGSSSMAGLPATDYQVDVERQIAGAAPGTSLVVRVPGGERPDGMGLALWGVPRFTAGDEAILFLSPRHDGTFGILHLGLGAFHRRDSSAGPLAVRDLSDASELVPPGTTADPDRHLARDLDGFADWLADRAAGLDRPRDYLVRDIRTPRIQKFNLTTVAGKNVRWTVFDQAQPVRWHAHGSGQAGIAGGGFAQFQQALSAWNADGGSNVRHTYAGTTGASAGFSRNDGQNTILFGDPNGYIDGAFVCGSGGTLAVGGPWYDSTRTHGYRGRTYVDILEADIVTNDGAECWFERSSCTAAAVAEVLTHELGHTLGMAHACGDGPSGSCSGRPEQDDATMRASAHGDCRGAALRADDRQAVRTLYLDPDAGSGGGGGTGGGGTGGGGTGGGGAPAAPPTPTGLTASVDAAAVHLAWTDPATDETAFQVERATSGGFAVLATVGANGTGYTDSTVAAGGTYRYRVRTLRSGTQSPGSNVVEVTLPRARPLTVGVHLAGGSELRVGRPVRLEAVTTGPAAAAVWDFDRGGVGFSPTACATGRFCRTHLFTEPGPHQVRVTVRGETGQTAVATLRLQVADGPWETDARRSFLQSVIFGPRGATGTFQSDLWLHNAGDRPAVAVVRFIPRGSGEDAPEPRLVTLEAAETLHLENVLETLFQLDRGQGSIAVEALQEKSATGAGPALYAMGRSYVATAGGTGTFGQLVGEQEETTWSADEQVVTGIADGSRFIATLLAANLDDAGGRVEIELEDRNGRPVGAPATLALGPRSMRFRPLTDLFPQAVGAAGPFTARFRSNGIRFAASATLLETGSEDQIFLPARRPARSDRFLLPRVVRGPGQFGVSLVSQLTVRNPAGVPTQLVIELLERGQDNRTPRTVVRTVPAGGTLFVGDVMRDLFRLDRATGALLVRWSNSQSIAPRVVSLALASTPAGERFGMLVDSQPTTDAANALSIDFGAEQSALFRSSYGVVNLSAGATGLRLTVRDAAGREIASRAVGLAPRQHLERNLEGLFPGLGLGSGWSVATEVTSGGPVSTYLANINASGDIFFVPGRTLE